MFLEEQIRLKVATFNFPKECDDWESYSQSKNHFQNVSNQVFKNELRKLKKLDKIFLNIYCQDKVEIHIYPYIQIYLYFKWLLITNRKIKCK